MFFKKNNNLLAFASLSLSSLSKPQQSQAPPKPSGPAMGTNPVHISPSVSNNNNDPFGFSTSPQKPTSQMVI